MIISPRYLPTLPAEPGNELTLMSMRSQGRVCKMIIPSLPCMIAPVERSLVEQLALPFAKENGRQSGSAETFDPPSVLGIDS